MRKQEVIKSLTDFSEKYWRNSNQTKFSGIPDFIIETFTDDEKFNEFMLENKDSKFYLILFKYNGIGYMDIMCRKEDYNQEIDNDRQWFREAVRFAVKCQNIRKKGLNTVIEPCLFEMVFKPGSADESMSVEIMYPPIDALDTVILEKED